MGHDLSVPESAHSVTSVVSAAHAGLHVAWAGFVAAGHSGHLSANRMAFLLDAQFGELDDCWRLTFRAGPVRCGHESQAMERV